MNNFIDEIIESVDNALQYHNETMEYLNKGGKITFIIDKNGTTIKEEVLK